MRWLRAIDRAIAATRPAWLWLGQLALVCLGAHLVADRLDDLVREALSAAELPWPWPEAPAQLSVGLALALELAVVVRAGQVLWRSEPPPWPSWRTWWASRSVETWVRPVFWAPVAASGAWAVAMTVEDTLAGTIPGAAGVVGVAVGALVGLRLGATGWWTVTVGAPPPKRRVDGLAWAPALLLFAALALADGLPVGLS